MWSLIDQLAQQGVTDFFFSSGSRSTPLVLAAAAHPKAKIHTHLDERAMAFFAYGCARAKEAPVAIIVTSGTAAGNLLPAIMEAHNSSVPLIVLTADRPPELREAGANQATDQVKMFQNFTRWQYEFDPNMPEQAIRSHAVQAVFQAISKNGPVHLNVPLREPFALEFPTVQGAPLQLEIGEKICFKERPLPPRGLILIGRLPKRSDLAPILDLAKQLQWPVFGDIFSNARLTPTPEQIRRFEWILPQAPKPACILHFGERFVSKRLLEWLPKTQYIHISPFHHWYDPTNLVTERIESSRVPRFTAATDPAWLRAWRQLDSAAEEHLANALAEAPFTESKVLHHLSSLDWQAIFLGTSMPVREGDWFLFPKKATAFYSNRGQSGIDGNIATAVGLAEGLQSPLLAIIGDLTALHDLNSLALVAQSRHPITLVISNNGGGGIFSHLPISKHPRYEELIAFQHDTQFKEAAAMFKLPYFHLEDLNWPKHKGSCIIEVTNDRAQNAAFHKQLREQCTYSFTAS